MHRGHTNRRFDRGFTLAELLVCVAVIALLAGLMMPTLRAGRESARLATCLSNQRQLVLGWSLYAADFAGRSLPASDLQPGAAVNDPTYWWGRVRAPAPGGGSGAGGGVEHEAGFLAPYLSASLHERSVYECPSQRWGTYRAQPIVIPPPGVPTSTYGYNSYYLAPASTPGWNLSIGHQPWKRVEDAEHPTELFVFADTLVPTDPPRNTAIIDPPMLFQGTWTHNDAPNTAFRHHAGRGVGAAATARADGSARASAARPEWLSHPALAIGSVGPSNAPHYVPDWERWK